MSTTASSSLLRKTSAERSWPVIHADWHDEPVLMVEGSSPYLVTPAKRDPWLTEGRHYIPTAQLRNLRTANRGAQKFDAIAIVHELDAAGAVKTLLPVLAKGPATCSDEVARLVVGVAPQHPGVARAVRLLDGIAGGMTVVRSAAGRLLDPIVFGVVSTGGTPLRDGSPAAWHALAAWRW